MSDSVLKFVEEVERFRTWVLFGTDSGRSAAVEALIRITRLYLVALSLPECEDEIDLTEARQLKASSDYESVYQSMTARLPLQYYGEMFNPLPVPPEPPVTGNLADDIADILSDLSGGMAMFQAGMRAQAIWTWNFYLVHHWGEHATSAIRALHCYLASSSPERLLGNN